MTSLINDVNDTGNNLSLVTMTPVIIYYWYCDDVEELIASVVGVGDKHRVVDIFANFQKNLKCPS